MTGGRDGRSIPFGLGALLVLAALAPDWVECQSREGSLCRKAATARRAGNPQRIPHVHPAPRAAFGQVPLSFEPNVGQVRGAGSERVKFVARRPGCTIFITSDEVVLKLETGIWKSENANSKLEIRNSKFANDNSKLKNGQPAINNRQSDIAPRAPNPEPRNPSPESRSPAVVRLRWAGANPNPRFVGLEELPGKSNYFSGHDPAKWRTNVPNYARVLVKDAYPRIDLLFYRKRSVVSGQLSVATDDGHPTTDELEFDFVVHPGADPRAIRLKLETRNSKFENRKSEIENGKTENGNRKMEIGAEGDLRIATAAGDIRLRKPVAYQFDASTGGRSSVRSRWVLTTDHGPRTTDKSALPFSNPESRTPNPENYLVLDLGPYDRANELIIDPVLSYSTYLGGSGYDSANALAVDSNGNAYITGQTDSLDFPSSSAAQSSLGGGTCGTTLDVYPCFDAFVTKLSATGSSIVYSTYFGGSGDDRGTGIAVDSAGNAYIAGITNSTDLPVANALQPNYAGGNCGSATNPIACFDSFVAKLSSSGSSIAYSTYLGGTGQDLAAGIALDSAGEATVAGSTSSLDFPVSAAAPQAAYAGGTLDAFVTRLDSAGKTVVFSTYLGGSGEDRGTAVAVNSPGDTFVTGSTDSADFPAINGFQTSNAGGSCGSSASPAPCTDAFVTRLNASGTQISYSTFLGGTGGDAANGIAVDTNGAAYVAGSTASSDFPTTSGSIQPSGGGNSVDAFVSKLTPEGSALEYSTYLGGIGQEAAYGIAVDSAGHAFVTGYANDAAFPIVNPIQPSGGGFNDAFVSKLSADGSALVFSSYLGGSGNESGQAIAVDAAGGAYVAGWTYSMDFPTASAVQPSYGGGSFDAFVAKLSGLGPFGANLSKTSLNFAEQGVSTSSLAQVVTLTSIGSDALSLADISASGDFTQTNDCASQLAPGESCDIQLVFAPTATGTRTGVLSVSDNALGSPQTVSLTGTGVTAFSIVAAPNLTTVVVGTNTASFTLSAASPYSYGKIITLACESGAQVQCAFDPANIMPGNSSTLTVGNLSSAAPSSLSFQVSGTSGGQSAIVPLTVRIADYSMSAEKSNAVISAGQSATFTLAVEAINGFSQPVSIDCSGAPPLATCQALPASVTPDEANSSMVSVTVATTAPAWTLPGADGPRTLPPFPGAPWIWAVLTISLGFVLVYRRKSGFSRKRLACGSFSLLAAMLLAGCGGGGQSPIIHRPGTPRGTYELKIRATSGQIVHTLPLTLQVN